MRCNIVKDDRQPNYKTPIESLFWGYASTTEALDRLLQEDIKSSQRAVYDVREAIRDALFLLGHRGKIGEVKKTAMICQKELSSTIL